jgi:nitrite reductase/ring-hydroxylating ferredoxin subunit/uncharacterized membrane protein
MRSRANFKGHPIHPALVHFPLAFLFGAAGFDVAGRFLDRASLWLTGEHLALAGVLTAGAAAIPGIIDYIYTVPPDSSGKKRATKHMLVQSTAVLLFVLALWLRSQSETPPSASVLALEVIGAAMLGFGGYMGGVLLDRNQIGVDHRYAGAGKWREIHVDPRPGIGFFVANTDELELNQMKLIRAGDRRVVLARTEDGWFAFDDHCTHRGGSLAGGVLICGTVQCPWHGSQFNVRTGGVASGPAHDHIATHRVETRDDRIFLILEGDA